MAENAGFAGANTVMFCVVFSVSTRFALVTACTRVESTGLALAAVPTGAGAMPWKLPAAEAGTAGHPGPKGWVEPAADALPEAEEELPIELLAVLVLLPEALPDE